MKKDAKARIVRAVSGAEDSSGTPTHGDHGAGGDRCRAYWTFVRELNRILLAETDATRLFRRVCDILSGTPGCRAAGVALRETGEGPLEIAAFSANGEGDLPPPEWPSKADLLRCAGAAPDDDRPENSDACPDGVFRRIPNREADGMSGLLHRIVVDGTIRGALFAEVSPETAGDGDFRFLFRGLAEDIGRAFHRIEEADAFRENEARYRRLFDSMDLAWALHEIVRDADGLAVDCRFLDMNPAFERQTGLSARDLIGRTILEALPDTEPSWIERYGHVVETGETIHFEAWSRELDRCFDVTAYRPRPEQFAVLFGDVTARKEMEKALRRERDLLNRLMDTSPSGVVQADADGTVIYANRHAEEILGLEISASDCRTYDDPRWKIADLDGHPFPTENLPFQVVRRTGRPVFGVRHAVRWPGGKRKLLSVNAAPLLDSAGAFEGMVATVADITEAGRREIETRGMLDAARALLECETFEAAARRIFDACRAATGAISGYVALLSDTGAENEVLFLEAGGMPCNVNPELPMPVRGLRAEAYATGRVVYENDFMGSPWVGFMPPGHVRMRNVMFAPLTIDGIVRGVIGLANKPGDFDAEDARIAGAFGDMAAIGLRRVRQQDALRESEDRVRKKLAAIMEPDGDIGDLDLSDVLDTAAVQSLMDDFHRLTGIGVGIIDLSGTVLVATGWQDICTRFHRVHPETAANCMESDLEFSRSIPPDSFKLYRCKNNMWDMATPIMAGRRQIGNLFLGQFFFEDEVPDIGIFREQARRHGFDEDEYLAALDRVPRWSREKVRTVMTFYAKFAGMVSSLSHGNIQLSRTLSERDRLLEELRERDAKSRAIVDHLDIGIALVRPDMRVVEANRKMREWFPDLSPETAPFCFESIQPAPRNRVCDPCPIRRALADGRVHREEMSFRDETGDRHYRVTASPVFDAEKRVAAAIEMVEDITEQLVLERQFRQAQKMEAIGQLTGGVAHDFNNLLQIINGGTDLAMEDIAPGHPAREGLAEVAAAGERAARLVSQLLLFSRRQVMKPESLALNAVVSDLLKMLGRVIGEHIRIHWLPEKGAARVHADRGMMEQVLMNLCVNARDAMPDGGVLTIETRDVEIDAEYCAHHVWATPGRYGMLAVTDSGCGMDRAILDRIFEPFFTTKEVGRGTGLGLATVYGIVKQHGGMISAYSEPGAGSTFRIYLPLRDDGSTAAETTARADPGGGGETILLAEDDEMVLRLARRILARKGYAVLTAGNGAEALDIFRERAGEIDMVLLDVMMPEMGGREAFDRMRALRPDLKALFASGYSENAIHTNYVLEEGLALLQKPFAPADLLEAVRRTLDGSGADGSAGGRA
jgi:PAS domain S-box-containing protein